MVKTNLDKVNGSAGRYYEAKDVLVVHVMDGKVYVRTGEELAMHEITFEELNNLLKEFS